MQRNCERKEKKDYKLKEQESWNNRRKKKGRVSVMGFSTWNRVLK